MIGKIEDGDKVFSHTHVVLNYFPIQADHLWKLFEMGLGTYSMQGFERQIKESIFLQQIFQ